VDTGFTFFSALSPDVASVLRNKVDGTTGAPPSITGFSPASGAVGGNIVVTGTGFGSASAVTVNGVSAPFVMNSATEITATVSANSTLGLVSVTTPAGTAVSSNNFIVTGSTVDLAPIETHFGSFSQGDTGDTYTINVTNVGTLTSTGAVAVVGALPSGLTATAIGGVGWTASLGTLTCTRSTPLIAGAGYPPITITVSVSSNAPAQVTASATVSNAGDANPANNSASDVTTVNASVISGPVTTLAAWDVHGLPGGANNFGVSPLLPITVASAVVAGGITRGSGVGTSGTGAGRGWGGTTF
jgi:uncharacterized repeat protein (TIGR01451 family)